MNNRKIPSLLCTFLILALALFVSGGCGGSGGSSGFAGGSGTEADPWRIATAEQLDLVRSHLGGHFVLTKNIDLSGYEQWEPLGAFEVIEGTEEDPKPEIAFSGVFDGGGHTISNITVKTDDKIAVGLFGCMTGDGAAIKNLVVENIYVSGSYLVAGVVGYAHAPDGAKVKIDAVSLSGTGKLSAAAMVGGIAGGISGKVEVKNCSAGGDIVLDGDGMQGMGLGAGFIVGGGEECTLENCRAQDGSITARGNAVSGIGAIAGCAHKSEYVRGCVAENVSITVEAPGSSLIGGMIGYAGLDEGMTEISGCAASNITITVPDDAKRIGMIVGGGFYLPIYSEYYPVPTAFRVSGCSAEGSISGGGVVGAVAGYVYNNSIVDESSCVAGVTVNNVFSAEMTGGDADSDPLESL